jgi:hypothetical protein
MVGVCCLRHLGSGKSRNYQQKLNNREISIVISMDNLMNITKTVEIQLKAIINDAKKLIKVSKYGDLFDLNDGDIQELITRSRAAIEQIAGSTLENHIKELCTKNNIPLNITTQKGIHNKKNDQINSDLAAANIYSKLDQKNVTAWLDLRNKAAHGKYLEYSKEQVELLISSIRDFITRNPA